MTLSPLYVMLDETLAARHGWSLDDMAAACLAGGARLLQIRAKHAASGALLASCERLVAAAAASGARVVVNDRADVARLAGAWGVHVGQDDLPVSAARRIVGAGMAIGLSTHTPDQIRTAVRQGIDYVAVGPVFQTTTKETGYEPVGLELVREAASLAAPLPVVAIGGITLERAWSVIAAGAASVAVTADLFAGGDPRRRVEAYLSALGG